MRCIRLTLAYEGTNYHGWQVQPQGPTVQAAVEDSIESLTGERVSVTVAGRTDAGVHALGQVAAFRTDSDIPAERLRPGLQSFLPDDIAVLAVDEVPVDFHATYDATRKRYRYVMFDGPVMPPFHQRYVHRMRRPLDATAMHEGAQHLLGTHDFRSFESHYPNKATSVRTVLDAQVRRISGWSGWSLDDPPLLEHGTSAGPFVCFDIEADGFLYNMVRTIVGTLVRVGLGQWPPEQVRSVVDAQDRSVAGATAPPHGLYLLRVWYEGELG